MECPKCRFEYYVGDTECDKCGIIFEKYNQKQIAQAQNLLNKCEVCGKEISKNAKSCLHCGEPNNFTSTESNKINSKAAPHPNQIRDNIGTGCLGIIFILGIMAWVSNNFVSQTSKAPNSISNIPTTSTEQSVTHSVGFSVSRAEYGDKWPYTIPEGTLNCEVRMVSGYKKQDITISYNGKVYAINGSARSSRKYSPLEEIWKEGPRFPGSKIPDPGIIQKGLALCR
jgi:hypothetical protein